MIWEVGFRIEGQAVPPNDGTRDGSLHGPSSTDVVQSTKELSKLFLPIRRERPEINDDTRYAFDYFMRNTVTEIIRQSPCPDITSTRLQYTLQLSQEHAPLVHGITAFACMHGSMGSTVHTSLIRSNDRFHKDVALEHFCKALEILIQAVRRGLPIEPILLLCILLAIYEQWQSNIAGAMLYTRRYKDLLEAYSGQVAHSSPGPLLRFLAKNVKAASAHICGPHAGRSFAIETGESIHQLEVDSRSQPHLFSLPLAFTSLHEASIALEQLADLAYQKQAELLREAKCFIGKGVIGKTGLDTATRFCLAHTVSRGLDLKYNDQLQKSLKRIREAHSSWSIAFDRLLRSTQQITGPFLLLQIRFFSSNFSMRTCRQTEEKLSDRFEGCFVDILNCIETYLKLEGLPLKQTCGPCQPPLYGNEKSTWLFQHGLLLALLIIAIKCRSTSVRSRAAGILLEINITEAPNRSRPLGLFANLVIDLEEQRARQLSDQAPSQESFHAGEIPEAARFLDVVLDGEPEDDGPLRVISSRFVHDGYGEIEISEYVRGNYCNHGVSEDGGEIQVESVIGPIVLRKRFRLFDVGDLNDQSSLYRTQQE